MAFHVTTTKPENIKYAIHFEKALNAMAQEHLDFMAVNFADVWKIAVEEFINPPEKSQNQVDKP